MSLVACSWRFASLAFNRTIVGDLPLVGKLEPDFPATAKVIDARRTT